MLTCPPEVQPLSLLGLMEVWLPPHKGEPFSSSDDAAKEYGQEALGTGGGRGLRPESVPFQAHLAMVSKTGSTTWSLKGAGRGLLQAGH